MAQMRNGTWLVVGLLGSALLLVVVFQALNAFT
jgi:hypothetical protein